MVTRMKIGLKEAVEDVEIAFQQLEYCLKASAYWSREEFQPDEFVTDMVVRLPEGDIHFPTDQFAEKSNIEKASEISISIAYACTALALDQALETADYNVNPKSTDDFDQLRCVIYLVRCAYAHRIAQPYWDVAESKRRVYSFTVQDNSIEVDTTQLHEKEFSFTDLGGHKVWHDISNLVLSRLREDEASR